MKSITIHNIGDELSKIIERLAKQNNESLSTTIKSLLNKATGLKDSTAKNENLLQFFGTISNAEAEEFFENTKELSQVDLEDW